MPAYLRREGFLIIEVSRQENQSMGIVETQFYLPQPYKQQSRSASCVQAIAEINQQTGSSIDPNTDANSLMQQTTQGLMAAVSRLPQLLDRKRTIEKHTNLLHTLLKVSHMYTF